MPLCASRVIAIFCLFSTLAWADRAHLESENERRWNTPPKLTPEQADGKSNPDNESPQPRFLPFSASFTLSAGGISNNAHSLSVGGGQDGTSFSQSASQAGSSFGNQGSGISASQSSSFSAGPSGVSSSDSNAFSLNHPSYGGNSQANSNSFSLGQATSSSHGNVVKGQATSGAHSGVGSSHSSVNSGASSNSGVINLQGQGHRQGKPSWTNIGPNHEVGGVYNPNSGRPKLHVTQGHQGFSQKPPGRGPLRLDVNLDDDRWQHRRPEVFITEQRPTGGHRGHRQGGIHSSGLQTSATSLSDSQQNWGWNRGISANRESWTQNPLTGPHPGSWSRAEDSDEPGLLISGASASSSASSSSPGSSSFGQSSSYIGLGSSGPISWTNSNVQTSGNAHSNAQGTAASIEHNRGKAQGSFSSSAIASNSRDVGYSQANAVSGSRGQHSRGQVTSQSLGNAFAQGTANAGSVSFVKFPGRENPQNLPRQFVRNGSTATRNEQQRRRTARTRDPFDELFTEITDTVVDIFDI